MNVMLLLIPLFAFSCGFDSSPSAEELAAVQSVRNQYEGPWVYLVDEWADSGDRVDYERSYVAQLQHFQLIDVSGCPASFQRPWKEYLDALSTYIDTFEKGRDSIYGGTPGALKPMMQAQRRLFMQFAEFGMDVATEYEHPN
jgi:hypothetical protein